MRKFLLPAVIGIVIIGGAILLYFAQQSSTPVTTAIRDILPFGSGEDVNIPVNKNIDNESLKATSTASTQEVTATKLFRISEEPVAGFVPVLVNKELVVRYTDRATGHIFEAKLPKSESAVEKKQLTNTTLPKVSESFFKPDGNIVLMRFLKENDEVDNVTLALTPRKGTSSDEIIYTVSATNLRGDIDGVIVNGNNINYVLKDNGTITSSTFIGGDIKNLFNSQFNNWNLSKAGSNLLLTTRAESDTLGYSYLLSGGSLKRVVSENGLVALSNNAGTRIVYSYIDDNITRLTAATMAGQDLYHISPTTIADKCIWSIKTQDKLFCGAPLGGVGAREPQSWYRGISSYSDEIWSFDVKNQMDALISNPVSEVGQSIDLFNPQLSPNEDFLIFINKKDLSLWALRLN